jgi:hypothetical protein
MGKSQLSYDDEQVSYLHKVYKKLNRGRKGLKQDIVDMSIEFTYDYFKKKEAAQKLRAEARLAQSNEMDYLDELEEDEDND